MSYILIGGLRACGYHNDNGRVVELAVDQGLVRAGLERHVVVNDDRDRAVEMILGTGRRAPAVTICRIFGQRRRLERRPQYPCWSAVIARIDVEVPQLTLSSLLEGIIHRQDRRTTHTIFVSSEIGRNHILYFVWVCLGLFHRLCVKKTHKKALKSDRKRDRQARQELSFPSWRAYC